MKLAMKLVLACGTASYAAATAAAAPVALPAGQDLVLAGVGTARTVDAAFNNPAAAAPTDAGAWFGLGELGAGYEVGDFDNLTAQIEQLERDLRTGNLTLAEAEALQRRANAFLQGLGGDGYIKLLAAAQPPFVPLAIAGDGLGGTLTFAARGITSARLSLLGDPVEVVNSGGFRIDSDTAAYGQGAAGVALALGYARELRRLPDSVLTGGLRVTHHTVELSRGVIALKDIGETNFDATQDALEDEFDRNRRRDAALGVDVGALWRSAHMSAGATLRNLNEPEFALAPLGQDCAALPVPAERRNCETAALFVAAGRVGAFDRYRLRRQLQVEGALLGGDRDLSLGAALDVNAVRDAVGDRYQWLSLSAAYSAGSDIGWPGLRFGYRHNLADSTLGLLSVGLSLFHVVHLDLAASPQMVEHDGHRRPRSAMASLSFAPPAR